MTTPNTAQQERLALAMKMAVEFGWLAKSVTYEEYLCACVNMQALLDACAPAAQTAQLPVGPALHVPSGFVFDEVLAAAVPSDLVPLTPQPVDTAQPATPPVQARYTVEPHGKGWAIYSGRDQQHHGWNLGHLSECDARLAALIERALNSLAASPQPQPDVALTDKAIIEAMTRRDAGWNAYGKSRESAVSLALACVRAALQGVQGGGN